MPLVETIAADDWTIDLLPDIGGSIARARHAGYDVLRRATDAATDPRETACFPLLPYANRIADGRFTFAGVEHRLPRTLPDHPHSLHGVGWREPWHVVSRRPGAVAMAHAHRADDRWPWDYHARQDVVLADKSLVLTLTIVNHADRAMPAGLGFHPYFPRTPTTRLTMAATIAWHADAEQLIADAAAPDRFGAWAGGESTTRATTVDNAYSGWDGTVKLADGTGTTHLTSDASIAHLYIPASRDFLCIEPVSHLPDAVNRGGMPVLAPGAQASLLLRITHEPAG